MTGFRTRRPTGKPSMPLMLLAGGEKCGKSYAFAAFSASPMIDRSFYIEIGEGAADQYGAIPGARYEIVEHDGTYSSIVAAIEGAIAQPQTNGKPHALGIDSMTELWDLLAEEAQATANRRAAAKAAKGNRAAPVEDVQITMDLWNAAKKRWRKVIDLLRTHNGPVVLTARLELVTVMAEDGKPTTAKDWKIRAEKNLPYEVDVIVRMPAPGVAELTGVRSLNIQVPPGGVLPMPGFTLEQLLTRMGLAADGATAPRAYTAPTAEPLDVEPERAAQRERGQSVDEWSTPEPSPMVPSVTGEQIGQLAELLRIKRNPNQAAWNHIVSAMVRRQVDDVRTLTKSEAVQIIEALTAEPDLGARAADPAGPTPNDPEAPAYRTRMMHALFREKGIGDDQKHAFITRVLGHDIETMSKILASQCEAVIKALTTGEIPAAPPAAPPAPAGVDPAEEGFDVFDALNQMILDVRDEASFQEAQTAIENEFKGGQISADARQTLRNRLAEQTGAMA